MQNEARPTDYFEFEALAATIPDIVYRIDEDGKFTYLNPAIRKLGYEPGELIGKHFSELILPADVKSVSRKDVLPYYIGKTINKSPKLFDERRGIERKTSQLEVRLVSRRKPEKWPSMIEILGKNQIIAEVSSSGIYRNNPISKSGVFTGTVGVIRDITDQRRMEAELIKYSEQLAKQLEESKDLSTVILENSPIGIFIVCDKKILYVNQSFANICSYLRDQLIGKNPLDLVPVEERENVRLNAIGMLKSGPSYPYEYRVVGTDGKTRWIRETDVSIHYQGKRATLGSFIDITNRKQMEDQLTQSEKKYATLVEHSNDGILVIQDGLIKFANSRMHTMSGFSPEAVLGKSFLDFIAPEFRVLVADRHTKRLAGEPVPEGYEAEIISKAGSRIPIEITGNIIEYEGSPAIMAIVRNISERKKAEKELRASEEKFRLFAENATDIIFRYSMLPEPHFEYVSPSVTAITGFTPDEYYANPNMFQKLIPQEDISQIEKFTTQAEAAQRLFVFRCVNKNGNTIFLEYNQHIINNQEGQFIGIEGIIRDVTEREQAEKALHESEEKYHNLVERANDGIAIIQDMKIEFCNRVIGQVWGGSIEDMIGRPFSDFIHPDALTALIDNYNQRMTGKNIPSYETAIQRKNGDKVYVEINAGKIEYKGKPADLVIIRDITERKKAEEQLRLQAQLLDAQMDVVIVHDTEGQIIYANNAAYRVHGYSKEELLKMNIRQLEDPESAKNIPERRHVVETKGMNIFETVYLRKNGSSIPFEVHAVKTKWGDKTVILSVGRDITERKAAELRVKESEAKYRGIFNHVPVSIFILDKNGIVLDVNPYHAVVIGGQIPTQSFIGKSIFENPGNIQAGIVEDHKRLLKGKPINIQDIHLTPSDWGPERYFNIRGVPLKKKGEVNGAVLIIEDITERKRAEEALAQSEEKFRNLAEQSPNMIFINKDGRILYANKMCSEVTGYSLDEIYSTDFDFFVLIAPESKDEIAQHFRLHQEGKELPPYEYSLVTRDGRRVACILTTKLINYGGTTAILGTITDITDRKKMEDALRESEQRFREMFEKHLAVMLLVEPESGKIVDANTAAAEYYGYPHEVLTNMNINVINQLSPDEVALIRQTVIKKGGDIFVTPHRLASGEIRTVEVHSSPIKVASQILLFSVIHDITDRKKAEQQLQESYEKLRQTFVGITRAISDTIELRDPYTAGHQVRVARLAQAIAVEMNLTAEHANQIYTAALIHDIGKISIPGEILSRPGILNATEFALIKKHSEAGYDILKNIDFPYPLARWVLEHHERMNGSGYPSGLSGDEISLEARILAVADVVEAMASHRPYRPSLDLGAALDEIIKNKGILYDDKVVDACFRLFYEKGFKLNPV